MPFVESWEEFEKAAERLYLQDPMKVRYSTKYDHSEGCLVVKMTDDVVCLQYKTDLAQDVKKMDKFVNNLMRHMASKEQHWVDRIILKAFYIIPINLKTYQTVQSFDESEL